MRATDTVLDEPINIIGETAIADRAEASYPVEDAYWRELRPQLKAKFPARTRTISLPASFGGRVNSIE